jgi:hypothetical protein
MTITSRVFLLVAALVALTSPAAAQVINLNTGFLPDPHVVAGTSGGPVSAQGVQANCRGFIPAQPSHVLITPTGFNFLRVFSQSSGDTTLMIRSTASTWCADDTYGFNPGLDLNGLPPGRYDIYVGSYSQGAMHPYQLSLSELQSSVPSGVVRPGVPNPGGVRPVPTQNNNAILNIQGAPNFGRIMIPRIMRRPLTARGRTGGGVSASSLQGEGTCRGYITANPDHMLVVTTPLSYLHLYVLSAADSTMVVRRPDGSLLCNDDTYNLNPSIEGTFPPGIYYVWVGGYHSGEVRPYQLTVTDNPSLHP